MPISEDILTLEIEPPYIGSAVSPTVDIDETIDDITVTITDFRGEHSYTVEKTDGAIADAEQAAQNANDTAQTVAQGWANRQNEINVTMNSMRTLMTNSANAESQRVIAENARVDAENAREQEWNELTGDVTTATNAANEAASNATNAANRADDSSRAANEMISRGNTTITNISNTANQIFGQAGQAIGEANAAAQSATDAATLANTKAGLADTAATAANSAASTATAAASTASSNAAAAANAASQANSAATTANSAAAAATAAKVDTEQATADALAAIEAMGDISELAVPEMSANIRGGAKLGVGLDVSDGRLNIDLSDSGSGSSVLTNGCALLDVEGDGWAEQDGTPTPENPVEIEVARGRNLLSKNLVNGVYAYATGITYGSDTYLRSAKMPCMPNAQYVMSSASNIGSDCGFLFWDANGDFISADHPTFTATAPSNAVTMAVNMKLANSAAITPSDIIDPQVELGSTATPYVPYGHVGLEVKQGSTLVDCIPVPIPSDGLAALPDGTHDTLSIDSAGHVVAGKRTQSTVLSATANIQSYTWNTHNGVYVPSFLLNISGSRLSGYCNIATCVNDSLDHPYPFAWLGVNSSNLFLLTVLDDLGITTVDEFKTWLTSNQVIVYYPRATPTAIDMGYIDLPLMPDGCTVSIPELHEIGVEWVVTRAEAIPEMVADVRKWVLHEIALAGDAELSTIAAVENATASTNYAVGSYLVHGGILYRVTTAIATGETINPGTNCTATTVMAELIRLTA